MRQIELPGIILLATTLLLSGCATNRGTRSNKYRPAPESAPVREHDPGPNESEPGSPIPPPPAPAAYGVSHVKSVGFLRVFGSSNTRERSCGTNACAEACSGAPKTRPGLFDCLCGKNICRLFGCKSAETSCTAGEECCTDDVCADEACGENPVCQQECTNDWANFGQECGEHHNTDRRPCLADRLEDPFIDPFEKPGVAPEHQEAPKSPQSIPAVLVPQAELPSPYSGVSSGRQADSYFPTESGRQRTIVEPPHWQDRHLNRSTVKYHSVTLETPAPSESTPAPLQITIQPRQRFGRYSVLR